MGNYGSMMPPPVMNDGTIQIHIDIKLAKKGDAPVEKFTKVVPKYKFHEGEKLFISLKEFIVFLVESYLPPAEEDSDRPDPTDLYEIVLLPTHSIITDLVFIEPGDKIKLRDKVKGANHFNFFSANKDAITKTQIPVKTEGPFGVKGAAGSVENPEIQQV